MGRRQQWVYHIEPEEFPPDFPDRFDLAGTGPAAEGQRPPGVALEGRDRAWLRPPGFPVHPGRRNGASPLAAAGGGGQGCWGLP